MSPLAIDQQALDAALSGLGLRVDRTAVELLVRHAELVREANKTLNLTRITDPAGMAVQHAADSLACLLVLDADAPLRVADIGSGAGWPGIALAIVCPLWRLTLIEATARKADFLRSAATTLGIGDRVSVFADRAEAAGRTEGLREAHDAAVARAVAPLATLAEYLLPLVRVGGTAVAMKGGGADAEQAAALTAREFLGASDETTIDYTLPGLSDVRRLVIWEKGRETPERFPRRDGMPRKHPL